MKRLFSVLLLGLVASCTPAYANEFVGLCVPTNKIGEEFADQYGEKLTITATVDTFRSMSVYTNPDTRTYTIFGNDGYGVSCILGTGGNFTYIPQPANL